MHNVKMELEDRSNVDLSLLTAKQAKAFVAAYNKAASIIEETKGVILISHMIEAFDMGCRRTIATPASKRSHRQLQLWRATQACDQPEKDKGQKALCP
jgi:hypothetical protein